MLHHLVMPDLGLPRTAVTASVWLVELGSEVVEGDRLLEVLAGTVTVDLPAPVSGKLLEMLVQEEDALHVGQLLATLDDGDQASDEFPDGADDADE